MSDTVEEPVEISPELPQVPEAPAPNAGVKSWLQDTLETLLLAVILFLVINAISGRYQVHGQSMEPSLHEGQYIIASKISYWLHPPERGDIVVLRPPVGDIPYIKRIIGLPGDTVEIADGRVWINGVAINEPYISGPPLYHGEWKVTDDHYFVLGDNRNNSSDSHVWGLLARDKLIGKAIFCYWPPEYWGPMPHYTYPELRQAEP